MYQIYTHDGDIHYFKEVNHLWTSKMDEDITNYGEGGIDLVETIVSNCGEIFRYWHDEIESDRFLTKQYLSEVLNPTWLLGYCAENYGWNSRMKNKL